MKKWLMAFFFTLSLFSLEATNKKVAGKGQCTKVTKRFMCSKCNKKFAKSANWRRHKTESGHSLAFRVPLPLLKATLAVKNSSSLK